ncbi:PLP-dependent transferase [Dendrothele bispora CBS 962.96]|uniref:PLP-dependent transferase n=1 Tax=Dendrothele bispora (strain CBS 962.96) TaxID=1314807 RepID=A0A4S8KQ34_DENBC|nr:PLP-dependent transferase [Dendrothele bispora CBS 962.96]THU77836.1 PLP-dependent transferase [Dendrothele bispora CBS 962.96]
MSSLDIQKVRASFPALSPNSQFSSSGVPYVFADNAGGSQALASVVNKISDYLLNTNAQFGADYAVSKVATKRVFEDAQEIARLVFGYDEGEGDIVWGSSTTLSLEALARSMELGGKIKAGDEIIVTTEHEANVGPWTKLASRVGATVKIWKHSPIPTSTGRPNPFSIGLTLDSLLPLLTPKTRLLAFTGCSNVLGSATPVADIVKAVRKKMGELGGSLEVSLDCVAYAPHMKMDVKEWDVDYCSFSWYKVYGPHLSSMYIRKSLLAAPSSPGEPHLYSLVHHFLSAKPSISNTALKLQPGSPGYELVYATTAVVEYLCGLIGSDVSLTSLTKAFNQLQTHDYTIIQPLLQFLTSEAAYTAGVRVVGDEALSTDGKVKHGRAPTVSFVFIDSSSSSSSSTSASTSNKLRKKLWSKSIVGHVDNAGGIGIRYGHFYAYGLGTSLGLLPPQSAEGEFKNEEEALEASLEDGVVRVSLVHYNTVEEVERIIAVLKEALGL